VCQPRYTRPAGSDADAVNRETCGTPLGPAGEARAKRVQGMKMYRTNDDACGQRFWAHATAPGAGSWGVRRERSTLLC
jgi:hypothetical protein